MTNQHPITPPPELVERWTNQWHQAQVKHVELEDFVATQAARWGADQELEACCHEMQKLYGVGRWLSSIRRPKPPSLKEQALEELDAMCASLMAHGTVYAAHDIRRALEQLDD